MKAEVDIQVPFFDVDSMRIAWHGHYTKYFEVARCQLLDDLGYGYQAMFDSGYAWPIVDLKIRFMRPLRFDQHVLVQAKLQQWDQRLRITYRVVDKSTGGCMARGSTVQVPVDMESGELLFDPVPEVAELLERTGIRPPGNKPAQD